MTIGLWPFVLMLVAGMAVQGPNGTAVRSDVRAPFTLPPPTGPHPVGTTAWRVTDNSRSENLAGPNVARTVEVLRGRGALGKIAPARAAEITRMIVRQYFDQE
ncbi:MAG: hypothetical protein ACRD1Q_13605, partial [Vicinamibacterales bacterium]